jgi:hypothetical protein
VANRKWLHFLLNLTRPVHSGDHVFPHQALVLISQRKKADTILSYIKNIPAFNLGIFFVSSPYSEKI